MTYGFIGTGNMGGALARALVREVSPLDVYLNNRTPAKAGGPGSRAGARADTAAHIAAACDYIFLGVKPNLIAGVLAQLAPHAGAADGQARAGVHGRRRHHRRAGAGCSRLPHPAYHAQHRLRRGGGADAVRCQRPADETTAGRLPGGHGRLRTAGGSAGAPDRRGQRRGRLRRRLACLFMEGLADGAVTCGLAP